MVEQLETLAETSAKAISNIKFDKVVVWDGGAGTGAGGTAGFLQNMAKTLPPMMHVLRDVAGMELPGFMGSIAGDGTAVPADMRGEVAVVAAASEPGRRNGEGHAAGDPA
jgi:flotillin